MGLLQLVDDLVYPFVDLLGKRLSIHIQVHVQTHKRIMVMLIPAQ